MNKTYEQEKQEWFDKNLKFVRNDFRAITCDRCNKNEIKHGAFGYGSSYQICDECYRSLPNDKR